MTSNPNFHRDGHEESKDKPAAKQELPAGPELSALMGSLTMLYQRLMHDQNVTGQDMASLRASLSPLESLPDLSTPIDSPQLSEWQRSVIALHLARTEHPLGLFLPHAFIPSPSVAEILALNTKGNLSLKPERLSVELAVALAKKEQGQLYIEEHAWPPDAESISPAAAAALAQTTADLAVYYWEISDEVAAELAKHRGACLRVECEKISETALNALKKHPGLRFNKIMP